MSNQTSSVKIIAIGDPHVMRSQVDMTDKMLQEIVAICIEEQPDLIVVLGDTLHDGATYYADPHCRAIRWFMQLHKIAPLMILIGNHDLRNNQVYLDGSKPAVHPFLALHNWSPKVYLCDRVRLISVKGLVFCGVPYCPPGKYLDLIQDVDTSTVTAFFSHQEFCGVDLGNNNLSTDGDRWPADYPVNFCGHIHEEATVAKNLIYVGTPVQQNYGASPDKGVAIIEFYIAPVSSSPVSSSPVSSPVSTRYTYKRRPITSVPIRKEYILRADDLVLMNQIAKDTSDDLIRVVLKCSQQEYVHLIKTSLYTQLKCRATIKPEYETDNTVASVKIEKHKSLKTVIRDNTPDDLLDIFEKICA